MMLLNVVEFKPLKNVQTFFVVLKAVLWAFF